MTLLSQLCPDGKDLPYGLRLSIAALSAGKGQPSTESVTSVLELALKETSETVYIVTDGPDQLAYPEQKQFLDFMASFRSDTSRPGTHIIVASSPLLVCRFATPIAAINISEQTSSDIKRLVANGIDNLKLQDCGYDVKSSLTHFLVERSGGKYVYLTQSITCP